MIRTKIQPNLETIPEQFHSLLSHPEVYDSSCSKEARVFYIPKDGGLFLKSAPKGTLETESLMSGFLHSHDLAPEVLSYLSDERDWLLTRRIPGEDCTHPAYLEDPKRLCDTLAEVLHRLHSLDLSRCPIPNRLESYIATAHRNYEAKKYDTTLFPDNWGYSSPEAAWKMIEENGHLLKSDTLIHGDYCLPNVMLDNWRFAGFLDVGGGGAADKHIDLFWGAWTLCYNLKTEEYSPRFLDAYGRENFEPEMLRLIAAFEVFE